jgi:hypothetical protein
VTDDQTRLLGAVLLAVLVGLAVWALFRARGRRAAQQGSELPPPGAPPADLGSAVVSVDGLFVGTTRADDWLARIEAYGLASRANATLSVHGTGLCLERDGSEPVWIPVGDLDDVRLDTGLAGKVVEAGGLVVLRWRLGGVPLDSGLRPRRAEDVPALVAAIDTTRGERR